MKKINKFVSSEIKVLVLTSSFPRYKNDWWQQAVLSIYSHMDLKKYDVTVLAPSAPNAKKSEKMKGVSVKRFTYFYPSSLQLLTSGEGILYTSRKNRILGKIQIVTFVLAELFSTLSTLARNNFDVIHANWILPQGLVAVIAKFIFKKPVIITVHGTDIFALRKLNFLKILVLKYCDVCTTNSSATYKAAYKLYPSPKIKIVPMGVDVKLFDPKNKDENFRSGYGKNSKIILGVGRLIKWKGFEYLVRAFPAVLAKFSQAKLIIVGTGPEEEALKKLAKKLNLEMDKHIFFPGHIEPDKFASVYASVDVVVSPSITNVKTGEKEGQGNVALEARASGTPVIASRSGGLVDTIEDNSTGLLFRERDFRELSEKLIYILSDKAAHRRLTKNGLNLIRRKYPWENTSSIFGKIYESLMTTH